ncbi:MAG: M20 family metallopeptidase [Myxococcales bacterium]|nr:M20 family metallopeptidase [Polyangiaceae bacterium]MDW8251387.1 M20 family metallopeptidase [Myxococcales bacterium]
MNTAALSDFIDRSWEDDLVPRLAEYIRVPAKSPHFDPDWVSHGYIEKVAQQAAAWCREQPIPGLLVELIQLPERTPLLFFEIPGDVRRTVLLYGHLDKQPEMTGWREGTGPWEPIYEDGKLYGRGSADDGYAVYASLTALRALAVQNVPHARCVGLIECCEESGSYDLPAYLDLLAPRLGQVDLVIGLDSGCGDYERLWVTTSLRGLTAGTLSVEVLTEGVHSGDASGIVPSSFRIARHLLDRLEDSATGRILPPELHQEIPEERIRQAREAAEILGDGVIQKFPMVDGLRPMTQDLAEALLNRTWRPALSVTGADGLPPIQTAGNVLRPSTTLRLSLRLPPTLESKKATETLESLFAADPPYQARVKFTPDQSATGWNAPPTAPWLEAALQEASRTFYQRPAAAIGEGGTIPFMAMLGRRFPQAQFLITGVLGPRANAHGPNEFLHVPYAKKLTACVAYVLAAHART